MNIQKNKNFNEEINIAKKKRSLKNEIINNKEKRELFMKQKELNISSITLNTEKIALRKKES